MEKFELFLAGGKPVGVTVAIPKARVNFEAIQWGQRTFFYHEGKYLEGAVYHVQPGDTEPKEADPYQRISKEDGCV